RVCMHLYPQKLFMFCNRVVPSDFLDPTILSINTQELNIKNFNQESEYLGGATPVKDFLEIKEDLKEYITKNNFQINSFYGIDFIRTNDKKLKFIEINPRLTTSYMGIRNIININPVEMIFESETNDSYLNDVNFIGHSKFTRLELIYRGDYSISDINETLIRNLTKNIPELITPPISFSDMSTKDNKIFSCFISTKSKTAEASQERFKEILQILRKYNFY
ncbi:MAG: ATP-grasp domain-containing protein, partial [Promethearchaeota archaeon]